MTEFIVAKSIAFAFPDSSMTWDIKKSTHPGARVVKDGIEITQHGGVFELTLELPHTPTVDAFATVDGTILKQADQLSTDFQNGDAITWLKYVTKIKAGSVLSVWVKNNSKGVFRGAMLTIRKLSDDEVATR